MCSSRTHTHTHTDTHTKTHTAPRGLSSYLPLSKSPPTLKHHSAVPGVNPRRSMAIMSKAVTSNTLSVRSRDRLQQRVPSEETARPVNACSMNACTCTLVCVLAPW